MVVIELGGVQFGLKSWCWSRRFHCNTASLHQAMRLIVYVSLFVARWLAATMLVHSILIIILVVRWCTLISTHWSAVALFDRGYPSFGNFDSTIPIDVVGMKSYINILFDLTCAPVRVTINKINLAPNRICPVSLACSETAEVWVRANRVSVMFFYPFSHWSPCFTDKHLAAFTGDLVNDTVLFRWFWSSLGGTKWNLSVVSDLNTVRMPWCCRQRRRTSDTPFM